MGLRDLFRRKALTASPAVVEALQDRRVNPYPTLGGTNQAIAGAYQRGIDASYGWIYSTQPAVRSVIDFIARNTAQLGLKLYERIGDNERQRDESHPAAQTMADPGLGVTRDAFIYRLVSDYLVWDNAYFLKFRAQNGDGRILVRLPPNTVTVSGGRFEPEFFTVWRNDGSYISVAPENIFHWFGYNPQDPLLGLSKLETLRAELATDSAIQRTLVELAKSGLKGGYIKRPIEAPRWDKADAERFAEQWRTAKLRQDGRDPILEEGMEFDETGISPKDAELLASRKFTKQEVASVYGVPMDAFGITDTNTPNTAEARRLVYADVLPPITSSLACQLDMDILKIEYGEDSYFFEFDLNTKLEGDLETRFPALTAAAGRPWRTVNETRALENLPPIDGGDDLTIPMNVSLAGDQGNPTAPQLPAPNVMPPQDPNKPPQDGSYRTASLTKAVDGSVPPENRLPQFQQRRKQDIARQRRNISEAQALMLRWYNRLGRAAGQKAVDWARYEREFAADINKFVNSVAEREGGIYVAHLGGGNFDLNQVRHYFEAMSEGTAEAFTKSFREDVAAVGVTQALETANNMKAALAGASIGARATVKTRQEAAKQAPGTQHRSQTWIADTDRHADLDGVSVPLGSDWGGIEPGSEPNCQCSVSIS